MIGVSRVGLVGLIDVRSTPPHHSRIVQESYQSLMKTARL